MTYFHGCTCTHIWVHYCPEQLATGRQIKAWSKTEIDTMIRLRKTNTKWIDIAQVLKGRTENSCRLRYHRLREEAKKQGLSLTMFGDLDD